MIPSFEFLKIRTVRTQILSISFSILFSPHYVEKNDHVIHKKLSGDGLIRTHADLYNELGLATLGLSQNTFEYAYKGYQYLVKKGKLSNTAILSICDLSQSSNKKRLYIIDLANNKMLLTSYVS